MSSEIRIRVFAVSDIRTDLVIHVYFHLNGLMNFYHLVRMKAAKKIIRNHMDETLFVDIEDGDE